MIKPKQNEIILKRLNTDKKTQESICESFNNCYDKMMGQNKINYDPDYKPDPDEVLVIPNFEIPKEILYAIEQPLSLEPYIPKKKAERDIKAIIAANLNDSNSIIFRSIDNSTFLSNKAKFIFSNGALIEDDSAGFILTPLISCCLSEGHLYFDSYFSANKIFDLKGYFRIATDDEVSMFVESTNIEFEDSDMFVSSITDWTRRRIVKINDFGVLEKSSIYIKEKAFESGIEIVERDGRIIIPKEKKDQKVVLTFLEDGVYKGPFTEMTFITNSKRPVN